MFILNSIQNKQKQTKRLSANAENFAPFGQIMELENSLQSANKLCLKLKFKIVHNKLNVIYPQVLPRLPHCLLPWRTPPTPPKSQISPL